MVPAFSSNPIGCGGSVCNEYKKQKINTVYWDYNGPAGQETVASNYSLGTATPTHLSCGLSSTTVCQIQAEADPANTSQPNLDGKDPMVDEVEFSTIKRGSN